MRGDAGSARSRPSLRTLVVLGLLALQTVVIGGVAATVYAFRRAEAHASFRRELELRATTLAALFEIEPKGVSFEASRTTYPEYAEPGTGAYVSIIAPSGKTVVRSPSLGAGDLEAAGDWSDRAFVHASPDSGPDGIPCDSVTYSFVAKVDAPSKKKQVAPPPAPTVAVPDPGSAVPGDSSPAATAPASVVLAGKAWTPPCDEERRYRIVVAADRRPRDAAVAATARFLALVAGVAILLAAAGGLVVARVVLRPVAEMTASAAAMSAEDPTRRIAAASTVRELRGLAGELNSAFDRLADALARQKQFTSDASHEIRTPVAVLMANSDLLLRRDRTPEEYRAGLEKQRRAAQRLGRIADQLLVLARAESGPGAGPGVATGVASSGDLAAAAREIVSVLDPLAAANGVTVRCHAVGEAVVRSGSDLLATLVQNLVANAIRYAPPGSEVAVAVARHGDDVALTVADAGPGIPPEHRDRVLERFYRVRGGNDSREGGGLGLSIVAAIVRAAGGSLALGANEPAGTVVRVTLPAA